MRENTLTPEESKKWLIKRLPLVYAQESTNGLKPAEIIDKIAGIMYWALQVMPDGRFPSGTLKEFTPDIQAAVLEWQDEQGKTLF